MQWDPITPGRNNSHNTVQQATTILQGLIVIVGIIVVNTLLVWTNWNIIMKSLVFSVEKFRSESEEFF